MEKQLANFLQSPEWRQFQASVGHKTFLIEKEGFLASLVGHKLPIVGKYLYCPRGPVVLLEGIEFPISNFQFPKKIQNSNSVSSIKNGMRELLDLAKKEKAGWIRIEPESAEILKVIQDNLAGKIVKAPHDMQPREVFVLDIAKPEEQLLAEMKPKTRYNLKLAQKKGVVISNQQLVTSKKEECIAAFLKLTTEMASRNGITTHSENYYRQMIESLPAEMLKIYVAEFQGEIIATNLILFFGKTATYLHGASGNQYRGVMAPYLLHWQAILDAKKAGYEKYDFGGINTKYKIQNTKYNSWGGITDFKLGFSPQTKPIEFPGSYDIVLNPAKYKVYRGLQGIKEWTIRFFK